MVNAIDVAFNLCLIVLFAVVGAHAWVFYQLKRNRLYLYVIGIFALYIVDELVIYMTEALDLFGSKYNELFMSSPSVKTVIYIGMAVFMILIQNALFRKPFTAANGVILIVFGLWLMFVPMLPHGATKMWLFYLPFQIFTFFFSLYGMQYMKKNPMPEGQQAANRHFHFLLVTTMIFSVLIALEDFFVIFFVDDYSSLAVSIYQRNHCEDVLRILYSITWIHLFSRRFSTEKTALSRAVRADLSGDGAETAPEAPPAPRSRPATARPIEAAPEPEPAEEESPPQLSSRDYKILLYAKKLHLTVRESEILKLLLENRNNQQISEELVVSIGTVKTHVHNIFQKVDVKKREELLRCFEEFDPQEEE